MTKIKIALSTPWTEPAMEALQNDYEVVLPKKPNVLDDAFFKTMDGAIAFCPVFGLPVGQEVIDKLPKSIKIIASFGVGVDHIDLKVAKKRGLKVTNTPDVLTDETADLTIGLMIAASRHFYSAEQLARSGKWAGATATGQIGHSLKGKTLGIVGMGRIGEAVAERAKVFGMNILYFNRNQKPEAEKRLSAHFTNDLKDLLRNSDIVSLHAPLTDETRHMINDDTLALMKKEAILINTGRGPQVDEAALVRALESGHLFAAGLDVYEFEPRISETLRRLPNVILLPHIGSATLETRTEMGLLVKSNIDAYIKGQPLLTEVQ